MWLSQEPVLEVELAGRRVRIAQDHETMHVGTSVWEASLALARWLDRGGGPALRGRRVLELGAGCGVAGASLLAPDRWSTSPGSQLRAPALPVVPRAEARQLAQGQT
eukprot:SM000105S13916  [mRNA]  locus=s105:403024:403344:- [translate_table: standard]